MPTRLWVVALAAALCPVGCERKTASLPPPSPGCPAPPIALRETFDCLRVWHSRGAYAAMGPYIAPESRDDVIDLLIVMDELLAANAGAQEAVRTACPAMDPRPLDLSYMTDWLELFSRDVQVIRQDESGDQATVTAQVSDRTPLESLRFSRHNGLWAYQPGPMTPQLVPLLRDLAHGLDGVTLTLSGKANATPRDIEREYEVHLGPRLQKIRQATRSGNAG